MCGNSHTGHAGEPSDGGGWGAGGGGVAMDGCAVLVLHSDAVFMEPLIAQVGRRTSRHGLACSCTCNARVSAPPCIPQRLDRASSTAHVIPFAFV